jgi:hypothetical protein
MTTTMLIGKGGYADGEARIPSQLTVHLYGSVDPGLLPMVMSMGLSSGVSPPERHPGGTVIANYEISALGSDDATTIRSSYMPGQEFPEPELVDSAARLCANPDGEHCRQGNHDCSGIFARVASGDLHLLLVS